MPQHTLWNHRNRGLWLLAVLILVIGGSITYLLYTASPDPSQRVHGLIALGVTVLASGLCVICATADWWLQR